MQETGRPFYRATYEVKVDTRLLPDGLLPFRVRSSSGEARTREFVVANHRGPSPVQVDATLTFSVGSDTGWTTHKVPSEQVDVLLNGHLLGTLAPDARRKYSLHIPAASLRKANVLTFRFAEPDDGMSLNKQNEFCFVLD